jgi:ribosome-binding factor A
VTNDYPRSHRVADFIQRELAGLIRTEVKDPRVSPMLTIASVEVSRDLSVAKVYYSLLDATEQRETQNALGRASGFLRRQLARQMNTRSVPQLRFYYDDSAERGAHMSALIADAVASNTTEGDIEHDPDATPGSGMATGDQAVPATDVASDCNQANGAAEGSAADSGSGDELVEHDR